uniref:Nuclear receptor coactivator 4 N-terminal domain-containing protein n=1 Tax=Urocitellus parryii TaxID=9999 RepID=A0A8D2I1E4_UROPR
MNTSQDQSSCSSNREALLRFRDSRRDLELAIGGVLWAEQQIKDNLQKVKAQIHSCISRHLECLQSREVWPCEQVDLMYQLKEETLQGWGCGSAVAHLPGMYEALGSILSTTYK